MMEEKEVPRRRRRQGKPTTRRGHRSHHLLQRMGVLSILLFKIIIRALVPPALKLDNNNSSTA
jgi:hypothetical protein